jgi:flagellar protein FlgJ
MLNEIAYTASPHTARSAHDLGDSVGMSAERGRTREGLGRFQNLLERAEKEGPVDEEKVLNVCYEMESLFIGTMLDVMRETVDETGLMGKSFAKDLFNDMLYDEYAKLMARSDHIGLARQIFDQIRV